MNLVRVRVARKADMPAVDGLRKSAFETAPWLPRMAVDTVPSRFDAKDTKVLIAESEGELLATVALTPCAVPEHADDALGISLPASIRTSSVPGIVVRRAAVPEKLRGRGLLPLLRRFYVEAAQEANVHALLSFQVAGSPNNAGMQRMGYEVHNLGTVQLLGDFSRGPTDIAVSRLPRARFHSALAVLDSLHGDAFSLAKWDGPALNLMC